MERLYMEDFLKKRFSKLNLNNNILIIFYYQIVQIKEKYILSINKNKIKKMFKGKFFITKFKYIILLIFFYYVITISYLKLYL